MSVQKFILQLSLPFPRVESDKWSKT